MKILLIGNGFDLAHGLPTRYSDFLDVCEKCVPYKVKDRSIYRYRYGRYNYKDLYQSFKETVDEKQMSRFMNYLKYNVWIEYFLNRKQITGANWVDFESDIEHFVVSLVRQMKNANTDYVDPVFLSQMKNTASNWNDRNGASYKNLLYQMKDNLDQLSKALELYFEAFVYRLPTEEIDLFSSLKIDKVLSFNYTKTYLAVYQKYVKSDFEICYIHGETDLNRRICNLVLGFDDHYLEEGQAILESVPFEKYYQRIVKRTDNCYLDWYEHIKRTNEVTDLYIYGHSLTPADGDILRKFICLPSVRTHVYYLDENDRAGKVANLAVVLGPDKLIEIASGMNRTFEFIEIPRTNLLKRRT